MSNLYKEYGSLNVEMGSESFCLTSQNSFEIAMVIPDEKGLNVEIYGGKTREILENSGILKGVEKVPFFDGIIIVPYGEGSEGVPCYLVKEEMNGSLSKSVVENPTDSADLVDGDTGYNYY